MKIIDGGVTAAKGFKAASTAAEIKYKGRTDMAMVFSEVPCVAAGTFTTNVVKSQPYPSLCLLKLKTQSVADLSAQLVEAKKELFNLRFQNATNQLDNTSRIKEVRKNIARIQTIITEKEKVAQ